ncbi:MAG TPA: beta-eliminating lyase-related protein [Ilumatobacteraceae bacterium]|nr:beta-eliminating lyase-related protein [Ilumatobacteraceae bacterium]
MQLPPPPARSFASDNSAGAHPAIVDAVLAANHGHAVAYGADDWTRRCEAAFSELFGADVTTLLTFNGTGANILALSGLLRPADAVICTAGAHIAVDETGAPERILGCKLIDVPAADGKLTPDHLDAQAHLLGNPHHVQPGVVSITQSTELGTVYTVDEVGALCDAAHRLGMTVHMDGARIANATAALGGGETTLRAFTREAGVDAVTFGGTKNGLLGAEAVVFLRPVERAAYLRKQVNQLASKMRFLAAQFLALLDGDRWLQLATHANAMCAELYRATVDLPHVEMAPPEVNSVFPVLPPDVIEVLQAWSFFWDWEPSRHQVRWMTSWDTTIEDVRAFAEGVTRATAPAPAQN